MSQQKIFLLLSLSFLEALSFSWSFAISSFFDGLVFSEKAE